MDYGLIGAKLGHSWSPAIHGMLGDYDYRLCEMTEDEFRALLARRDFRGINVTIPYKKVAFECCDCLSDTAREVGSVNTVVVQPGGHLYGHNTDIGGFMSMAARSSVEIAGRRVAILGTGGTSLTAQAACRRLGAADIVVVSRRGPVDYEALTRDHADVQVLINTTPVGMYPDNGACPVDIRRLPALTGVLDVIYNPVSTALILDARARGIPCGSGLYMLVGQAREAAELFTGRAIDPSQTDRIYAALRMDELNVVLTGMPGSGKSLLGRLLAERMGRTFIDCDQEIERRAGRSIPDIFARDGEAAFRELEAQVIFDIGRRQHCVIATGGGAVLRQDNVRALRQNGVIALIRRPLTALSMEGRPLSRSREALEAMWQARKGAYLACADITIDNSADADAAAARLEEAFYEAAGH